MIEWCVENGIGTARVKTERGCNAWIVLPFLEDESAEMALHEYLDELGYDDQGVRLETHAGFKVKIPVPEHEEYA